MKKDGLTSLIFSGGIYKNNQKIKWKNKVHEVLEGYNRYSELPHNKELCLIHNKTIERQEKQNKYYSTL